MNIVVIELDGFKPTGTYYNRLRELGVAAGRLDDETKASLGDPLIRRSFKTRSGEDAGTVVQEGVVICHSESLANQVARLATEYGAKHVLVGTTTLETFSLQSQSLQDSQITQRIENLLSRPGRRPDQLFDWVVTCFEECVTYKVEQRKYIVSCPGCRGLNIRARKGKPIELAIPDGDLFKAWIRHRFASGQFEIPLADTKQPPDYNLIHIQQEDKQFTEIIEKSISVVSLLEKMPQRVHAFEILDALFASRSAYSQNARNEARLRVSMKLMEEGVNPSMFSITEPRNEVDLIDVSSVIGTDETVALFHQLNSM